MKKCCNFSLIKSVVLIFLVLLSSKGIAQESSPCPIDCMESDGEFVPSIGWTASLENPNEIAFSVCCQPELGDEASSEAHYQYFWDFGDGTFFKGRLFNGAEAKAVIHTYAGKNGGTSYRVTLEMTKVYTSNDKGKVVFRARAATDPSVPGVNFEPLLYDNPTRDAYMLPSAPEAITLLPVRDLVPAYLQTFVITYTEACTIPTTNFVFGYPHGTMSFSHNNFSSGEVAFQVSPNAPMAWSAYHGDDTEFSKEDGFVSFELDRGVALGPDSIRNVFLSMYADPTLTVGDSLSFTGNVGCPDLNMTLKERVSGSHDPNLKDVDIKYIHTDDPVKLTYTIQFQNEGDFPENNITVRDTLSEELAFCTVKVLSAQIGDRKAWDVDHIPPFLRDLVPNNVPLCEVIKNPGERVVEFKITNADLLGLYQSILTDEVRGDGTKILAEDSTRISDTWGIIEYEVYTSCDFEYGEIIENDAWVTFGEQAPQKTDSAVTKKYCTRDLTVTTGQTLTLDMLSIARQDIDPQLPLNPRSIVILYADGGIPYPSTAGPNGTFDYTPTRKTIPGRSMILPNDPQNDPRGVLQGQVQTTKRYPFGKWLNPPAPRPRLGPTYPALPGGAYVDRLRYVICDVGGNCYYRTVNVFVNLPDSYLANANCDTSNRTCVEAECVKDLLPFEKWILWLIIGILLILMFLIRLIKGKKGRRRSGRN